MQKDDFSIEGMVCASCAQTIEKAVSNLDGVEDAAVNLATESMKVSHAEKLTATDIIQAVKDAGYDAKVSQALSQAQVAAKEQATAKRLQQKRTAMIWALVFAVLLMLVAMGSMLGLPVPHF